jgi:hypothetical protein
MDGKDTPQEEPTLFERVVPIEDLEAFAIAFGHFVTPTRRVDTVFITPVDFYRLQIDPRFTFDRETERRVLLKGVVGYIWGAVIRLDFNLPHGSVRLSGEDIPAVAGESLKPFFLP